MSRSIIPLFAFMIFLFSSIALTNIQAQASDMPDSLELREYFDHAMIFDGQIEIGRTYTKLYISGDGLDRLELKAFNDKKEVLEFEYNEQHHRYQMDYLKLPILDLSFEGSSYRVATELIQVDWPGNEINWRMIPLLTFQYLH